MAHQDDTDGAAIGTGAGACGCAFVGSVASTADSDAPVHPTASTRTGRWSCLERSQAIARLIASPNGIGDEHLHHPRMLGKHTRVERSDSTHAADADSHVGSSNSPPQPAPRPAFVQYQ
jgi:hypothetical protein